MNNGTIMGGQIPRMAAVCPRQEEFHHNNDDDQEIKRICHKWALTSNFSLHALRTQIKLGFD